jgi:predicted SAM-dependent methyltransferase
VYHAHFLEHVPRDLVPGVLTEIRRVLRADGVHRIVVPDLEILVRRYLESLERRAPDHDGRVHDLLEQMVREEAWGSSQQPAWRRRIENLVLGDARRRGEVHRWGWDEQNLGTLLSEAGFRETKRVDPTTSLIPNWEIIDLDRGPDGSERKPDSLYLEALR